MKTSVAVLGCGNLGYDLASCISEIVGKENLHLTNRNKNLREKYRAEGFNVCDNQEAVNQADYVCLLTQPQEVDKLLDRIRVPNGRVVVNFTPKRLNLDKSLIQVACSLVIDGRIRALLYQKNGQVSEEQIETFRDVFSPVVDYFAECDDPVRELGVMSQVYAHLVSYHDILLKQGANPDSLRTYFDLACESLKSLKGKVRTKRGLTDSLFDFEEKNLADFVNSEREVLEERLQWIQTE
ncbi:MAG: NAD(P)-binding domain-containing protein [Candidatus Woesearchaeota archaeon]